jgi:hypothetical protein
MTLTDFGNPGNQKTDNFTNILEQEHQIILKSFGARKTNDFKIFLSK